MNELKPRTRDVIKAVLKDKKIAGWDGKIDELSGSIHMSTQPMRTPFRQSRRKSETSRSSRTPIPIYE